MAKTELLQVRIDADVKREAAAILESLGTNVSASINMYLKQIIIHKGIPFQVVMPDVPIEELLAKKQTTPKTQEQVIVETPVVEPQFTSVQPVQPTIQPQPVAKPVYEDTSIYSFSEPVESYPQILTEEERNRMYNKFDDPSQKDNLSETELKEKYNRMFRD